MEVIMMKNIKPSTAGLLQALGVISYTSLMSGFFMLIDGLFQSPQVFFPAAIMLTLLVFSAAISGSIVFGYPVLLALKGKVKEAISVLMFTLLYLLGMILVALVTVSLISL